MNVWNSGFHSHQFGGHDSCSDSVNFITVRAENCVAVGGHESLDMNFPVELRYASH